MTWELRGLDEAVDAWIADDSPDFETVEAVLWWVADLRDDPEDEATTVFVDETSATRVGCAPGTTVLMRYTLDVDRRRLIVRRLVSVPD